MELSYFQKSLQGKLFTEAPGDEDDPASPVDDTTPPDVEDVPEENTEDDVLNEPLDDTNEDVGGDVTDPPDLDDDFDPDAESISSDLPTGDGTPFDKKISDTLNRNLYQHYISLKKTINQELNMLEDNMDYINSDVMKETNIVEILKKLETNMELYLGNSFLNSNFSKNVLFYNKCLNMVNLVNIEFEKVLKKMQ